MDFFCQASKFLPLLLLRKKFLKYDAIYDYYKALCTQPPSFAEYKATVE